MGQTRDTASWCLSFFFFFFYHPLTQSLTLLGPLMFQNTVHGMITEVQSLLSKRAGPHASWDHSNNTSMLQVASTAFILCFSFDMSKEEQNLVKVALSLMLWMHNHTNAFPTYYASHIDRLQQHHGKNMSVIVKSFNWPNNNTYINITPNAHIWTWHIQPAPSNTYTLPTQPM